MLIGGVVIGNGANCSCNDCPVLYGGKCHSTALNDRLDALERALRCRMVSGNIVTRTEAWDTYEAVRSHLRRWLGASAKQLDKINTLVWAFTYMLANGHQTDAQRRYHEYDARLMYVRARDCLYWEMERAITELKTKDHAEK